MRDDQILSSYLKNQMAESVRREFARSIEMLNKLREMDRKQHIIKHPLDTTEQEAFVARWEALVAEGLAKEWLIHYDDYEAAFGAAPVKKVEREVVYDETMDEYRERLREMNKGVIFRIRGAES